MAIDLEQAALGFAAAGSEPRLEVLLALVRAGEDGLMVGQIQDRLQIPASTLAHHLRCLADAGLIEQEKLGRSVISRARYGHIEQLAGYLLKECCADAAPLRKSA
jgi:DNA-binding transcriptional ArsR family regulator